MYYVYICVCFFVHQQQQFGCYDPEVSLLYSLLDNPLHLNTLPDKILPFCLTHHKAYLIFSK